MTPRPVLFVVLLFVLPEAYSQEAKESTDISPTEAVKAWHKAAAKRDMKALATLASKDMPKHTLDVINQQGFLLYRGETTVIHEEISGDRAVVVFRLENRDAVLTPEISYGVALLLREEGAWKFSQSGSSVTLKLGKK